MAKRKTAKKKAWKACSWYIRLKCAMEYCNKHGVDLHQFVRPEDIIGECITCGKVLSWIRMDAGHWKGRGLGGGSGTYFDERNIHLQCKRCNGFEGGRPKEHEEYIRQNYGQEVVEELERKHRIPLDTRESAMKAMEIFYKEKFQELLEELK